MIISWGIPTIKVYKFNGSAIGPEILFPTPVDGSTELSTEKGDKMEALVEGGEAEAIKYKRGKYTLTFQIRRGANRNLPINGVDGVVDGEYRVVLEPEQKSEGAPGFAIRKAVCSYEDSYTSSDGAIRTYTFESLKVDGASQIDWDDDSTDDSSN